MNRPLGKLRGMSRGRRQLAREANRLDLLSKCGEAAGLARWAMAYDNPSERVFENLVESFRPRARAIVGFHRIPPEDADDLVQQTYLTYLSRWREVRHPEAWLAGTLRRRCLMFWRSRRQSWLSTVEDSVLDAQPAIEASPQTRIGLRLDLTRLVSRLPRRSRRLLQLRYGWGCDYRETAERLGYKYSGIYTISKRCLEALAEELVAEGWRVERIEDGPVSKIAGGGEGEGVERG